MSNDIVSKTLVSGNSQAMPICQPNGVAIAYTLLRHIGFILDELCAQGLVLWVDDVGRWWWRWQGSHLESTRGFWAMGEAVVDAVNGRYPETFAIPDLIDVIEQKKTV